ncbi:MAG: DeoR/GlpR family DNA-binding transcription regulator [Succinivibrionaceae bacterium]
MNIKLSEGKLSKSERQKVIVTELQATPTIRASELAIELRVSTETIRRDLEELESKGLISRTYGGAVRPLTVETKANHSEQLYLRQRELIAKEVSSFVNHGDVLIIGGGSTTSHVARRLAADKHDLTVITDSFAVATILSSNSTIRIQMCPGTYNAHEGCVYGSETVEYLSNIYANHAILGSSGLSGDGVSCNDMDIVGTYRAMVLRSNEVTIVADHSKISKYGVSIFSSWKNIDRLIIDQDPCDEELSQSLRFNKVKVMIAKDIWW